MSDVERGHFEVPGASLSYEIRGSGPAVLFVVGGNGDARIYSRVAAALANRFRTIAYTRRGFANSPLTQGYEGARRIEEDAHDAARMIDGLAGGKAHVFGSSSGAIVALDLLQRHAAKVETVVAHEPPIASILPDPQTHFALFEDILALYRKSGAKVAMPVFLEQMGMGRPTGLPPGVEPGKNTEGLTDNEYWFEHELAQYPHFQPNFATLGRLAKHLVLAGGRASREQFAYQPNKVLAERLGKDIVEFPGGHVGYATDPQAFADELAPLFVPVES
ncbi:MAG TPA: alpha/beta hydrolase [Polyangiaceae bacterium]